MRAAAVVLLLVAVVARPALAFEEFEGTRAEAMGGATRAWALADSAPLLNPSGMSLSKAYNVEASYAYGTRLSDQFLHASVVDSTSASSLAGGLYYTYHLQKPTSLDSGHAHELGAALSLPVGKYLALGATGKWFRLEGTDEGTEAATGGVTFDVGATVRPSPLFSLALVGANLRDLRAGQVPRSVSYGAAFIPIATLVLALDGVTAFTRDDVTGLRGTGIMAGGELSVAQRVAIRVGGGTDPMLGVGYLAAGASLISEVAAVDVGLRADLFPISSLGERNLFLGVSLRLFVGQNLHQEPDSEPEPMSP